MPTLGIQLGDEIVDAREVATRPGQACDEAICDRSPPPTKTIGIDDVALFAACAAWLPPPVTITSTLRPTRSSANAGSRS